MVASPEINMKVDAYMVEANKAYDRGDFDDASAMAAKVLARDPSNVKMLRVMVSAACINGDNAAAQKYYAPLPEGDRSQMRTRCERYGVTFDSIKPNP
jgi:thioredoxin-like negative regulator of GroEL